MKKILLAILFAIMTFLAGVSSAGIVFAYTTETQHEYNLNSSSDSWMINGWSIVNGSFETQGFEFLFMGQTNTFEIDLRNAWDSLTTLQEDTEYFQEAYLILELLPDGTSAANGFWNYNDQYLGTMSSNTLIYSFDVATMPDDISFTIWWANDGVANNVPYNDTGSLKLLSMTLIGSYVSETSGVIDVGTDYASLPDLSLYTFAQITSFTEYNLLTNSYHLTFDAFDDGWKTFQFDLAVPEGLVLENLVKTDGSINAAYTVVDGDRILYLQPDLTQTPIPSEVGTTEDPIDLVDGFAVINLSTMDYSIVNKLELNSITYRGDYNTAYMYGFFDPRVEDILSITISYRYRYVYLFGAWTGDWVSVTNTYEKGEQGWILGMNPLWIFNLGEHHELDEIYPITQAEIPDDVMDIYQDDLGGSTSDLDSLNLYRIRLQQFPGTTLITGYDIQNIITTKILYVYQGEVYEAATDVINQDNVEPELTSTIDWMAIADWILANWQYILIGVVGILVLSVAAKAFTAVSTILGLVFKAIGAAIKGFGYLLKYMTMGVYYFLKFVFYWLPKGIWGFLVFLVVPSDKRRKGKERGIYAGRSL